MKLRATIERKPGSIKATFPKGDKRMPTLPESILTRNIGPRPYAEIFFHNDDGQKVLIWIGQEG